MAEIIGEKWNAGGIMEWAGMRGGVREVAMYGAKRLTLGVTAHRMPVPPDRILVPPYRYEICVDVLQDSHRPRVMEEQMVMSVAKGPPVPLFSSQQAVNRDHLKLSFRRFRDKGRYPPTGSYINTIPGISQIVDDPDRSKAVRERCKALVDELASCRFLNLSPTAMRLPSIPGQVVLGDRGDNLSSVLQMVCSNERKKSALLDWVRQLTPMDAVDFDFPSDQTGRVLLTLVEGDGRRISAYSASDGTLRLLAMLAALLGPEPARFYFLEELENGIHPNRLALLVQLLETTTAQGKTQVVATTHSPQLLRLLSRKSLECASVVYRLPDTSNGRIKKIIDIPHIREVLETQDLARLHESGWLEDILSFSEAPDPARLEAMK